MIVLGISCFFHHDPAAALMVDGAAAAACEEERFAREKHAPGLLPVRAASACLRSAGIGPGDVDVLAASYSPSHYKAMRLEHLRRTGFSPAQIAKVLREGPVRAAKARRRVDRVRKELGLRETVEVRWVPHHEAHAASAFFFSGFPRSAILTLDGRGELDAGLLAEGLGPGISVLRRIALPDSLGMFYSAFTQFLGFAPNDGEYKLMGMAPYGDPAAEDLSEFIGAGGASAAVRGGVGISRRSGSGFLLYPARFEERWGPARAKPRLGRPDTDIAAAAQRALEQAALAVLRGGPACASGPEGRICLAGGVALNVKMNRALLDATGSGGIFVPPAPSDAGSALGAAAAASAEMGFPPRPLEHAFLGPGFGEEEIASELRRRAVRFERPGDLASAAAGLVAAGKVAGLFAGRMEFGPRALGNRSIIAHPGLPGTAERINRSVKFREPWRPFCPSVLREAIGEVTGDDRDSPYMALAFPVRESWKAGIAEAVHVDGSTRPQTVDRERCPLLHGIVSRFRDLTGIPAVLNTSLNRAGEPIAMSPAHALDIFFGSGMDCLFLGPFLLEKEKI